MKKVALVLAGGVGARTGQDIPKQFITVFDTPLLIYTLKNIQNSNCYDDIYVVCADGWKDFVSSYAKQYNITAFRDTIQNGNTRFDSCYNGIMYLADKYSDNDIISVMDGNRPLTPVESFKESIDCLKDNDCVLLLQPSYETLYQINPDSNFIEKTIPRNLVFSGQNPETTYLHIAKEIFFKAKADNLTCNAFAEQMLYYNKKVTYIKGSAYNFKITTADDFRLFKSIIEEKMSNGFNYSRQS